MSWVLLGLALALATRPAAAPLPPCDAVPGWLADGSPRVFTPDNLYDYIDGGAEEYLAFRFQRLDGLTCRLGNDTIAIDLYTMADRDFAYGVFTAHRTPERKVEALGMGGQLSRGRAIFAKGPYYVEVNSEAASDYTPAVRTYAEWIAAAIDDRDTPPAALGWFPQEGLVAGSVRLVPQSVLGVSLLPCGYVAKYQSGEAFVVVLGSAQAAEETLGKLAQRFGETKPVAVADAGFTAHDRYLGRLLVFRKGARLAGYARLAADADATRIATRLARVLPE